MKRSFGCVAALFLFALLCRAQLMAQTPAAKEAVIEIPFEFIHGEIIVQASLNGNGPFSMMLDTGADPSIVELSTAKSLALKISSSGATGSGGGTDQNLAYETSLPLVQLGGLAATNVDALAMDLSKISSGLGRPITAVLGYSLLKKRIVQIDYPHQKVRFLTTAPSCPAATHSKSRGCTLLPFRYKDDILASGVTLNGKPVTANVDTGSNSNFQLTPAAVDRLGLSADVARAHPSSSTGFNGNLKNREGTVRNVRVGTISLNEPPVVFFGQGMGMDKEHWDLRIGSAFLKDYVVTLDYPHGRITLAAP
jgi:predicted aspartyl protease